MPDQEQKDLAERTKSGLIWNTSLRIASQIFRFSVGVILARILDPVDFGIMAIGHMVIHYSNSLSDFGFTNAIVQKHELKAIHVNSIFTLNLGISLLLTVIIAGSAPYIGHFFNSPESGKVLFYMSCLFILRTFRDIFEALLRRDVLFKFVSAVKFVENVAMSIIALTLALLGLRYWSLVWATIASNIIGAIFFFFKSKARPKIQYNHQEMKKIYSFGIWNFIRVQLFFINQYITQIAVGKLFGATALGYYEKAYQLASTPRESIATQINSVMFSSFSRIQNDNTQLREWLTKILIMESVIILPLMIGIIAVSDHFIVVVLGSKWTPSIVPLQILSFGLICQIFNGLIASLNVGIGKYKQQTLLELPATIIFIFLCFFLKAWGINGISAAYSISMLLLALFTFSLSKKVLNLAVKKILVKIFPYLLINILMLVLIRTLGNMFFDEYTVTNLLIQVTIGIVFYSSMTVIYNTLSGKGWLYPVKY